MEENQRIYGENESLRKELEEARSQSVQQLTYVLVQRLKARDEVRRVLFWEENVEPRSYATPEACKDQSGKSTGLQRPNTS